MQTGTKPINIIPYSRAKSSTTKNPDTAIYKTEKKSFKY